MKLYLVPAGRANSVLSLKNYLGIDCEVHRLDFTPWRSAQAHLCQAQSQQENANARRRWLRALGVERHPVLSGIEAPRERAMALGREGPGRRHALAVVGKRALGCRGGWYGLV